ncbi:MAG: hypothetical protein ACFB0C_10710 [Leptolyngbyaceae cyanobacterium]
MPLPDNFSPSEHLQDLTRKYINRQVRNFFQDLGGEDWDPDITTTRGSLRYGCTHQDNDSLTMTLLRWNLFNHVRTLKFQQPFYGIPVAGFHESRRFKPQISLYFQEDEGDVEPGFSPVSGQITCRIMNHTSSSLNPSVAQTYANRINSEFAIGGGYIWKKGRTMVTYTDREKGYKLQLLCFSEAAGTQLITKVLDIQNDTPDWSRMNVSANNAPAQAYPPIPDLELVYGQSRRLPRKRPVADVRFQFAVLNIHGLQNPQPLVDRSGIWPNALVG